ncbi:MAG: protoporphyrinogen oxidase [Candidatus Omnitrophica bacterium]|nr:protoporphyrinogen oxidase [Candidatus Omnitrophota bacterium]
MEKRSIAIIGGGISGLATAYYLDRLSEEEKLPLGITVYEKKNQLGGVLETFCEDDFCLEGGPDSFISEKPWAASLCRELGLANELMGTNPNIRQSFVLWKGRLHPIPEGFYLMAPTLVLPMIRTPLLSWQGKFRMAMEAWIPRKKFSGDESVASFIQRRFGHEILERLGQPLIGGIYSADPENLSLEATFPRFLEMEKKHGSVTRALMSMKQDKKSHFGKASGARYSLFMTLRDGMVSLVQALEKAMPKVRILKNAEVRKVECLRSETWRLEIKGGLFEEADSLCLAMPTPAAAKVVGFFDPSLADDLKEFKYESVATVHCLFERKKIRHPLNGLGYVVPASQKKKIIGCTFSSMKFPGKADKRERHEFVLLRAFVGGAFGRASFDAEDKTLKEMVAKELCEILGIETAPLWTRIFRYPESMPQYEVGHLEHVQKLKRRIEACPGLYLTGNAYRGIGIPDCIRHAELTADRIFGDLLPGGKSAPQCVGAGEVKEKSFRG